MSIGPEEAEEKFETTIAARANFAVKKAIEAYVKDPIGNVFYFSLAGCMIVLLFNKKLPFEFYLILGILAIVEAYKFFAKQSVFISKEIKENA